MPLLKLWKTTTKRIQWTKGHMLKVSISADGIPASCQRR